MPDMTDVLQPEMPPQQGDADRSIAVLCLVAALVGFGVIPIFLRSLTRHLDAWTVNAVRYSTAALFWLPFVVMLERKRKAAASPPRRSVWRDALVPSAVNLGGQVGWALCPYFVEASTIGFVIRMSFLFTILFGFLLIPAERLLAGNRYFLLGAGVCVLGVGMMFLAKLRTEGRSSLPGMGILLGTAVFWGAYAVSIRRYMRGYSLRLSFGVISLYTAAALVVLMLLLGDYAALGGAGGRVWLLLIASGFIGIAFSHVLYYRGIHRLGPVVSSGILMATPFVTLTGAFLILKETMTPIQWLGGLSVVAGGVLLVKAKAQIESGA